MFMLEEILYLKNSNKNTHNFAFLHRYNDAMFNYVTDHFCCLFFLVLDTFLNQYIGWMLLSSWVTTNLCLF